MISVDQARQQARDLVKSGDPDRPIMIMTTPFMLGVLALHLAIYADAIKDMNPNNELLGILNEICDHLQKTVMQILRQEFPPS